MGGCLAPKSPFKEGYGRLITIRSDDSKYSESSATKMHAMPSMRCGDIIESSKSLIRAVNAYALPQDTNACAVNRVADHLKFSYWIGEIPTEMFSSI